MKLPKLNFYIWLLLFLSFPLSGFTQTDKKPENIIALGTFQPINSDQGQTSPLLLWIHNTKGYPGNATLNGSLKTSILNIGLTHNITPNVRLGYQWTSKYFSKGFGSDLYLNGELKQNDSFNGNSNEIKLTGEFNLPGNWSVTPSFAVEKSRFYATENSSSNYEFPSSPSTTTINLSLTYKNLLSENGQFRLMVQKAERNQWETWRLDTEADEKRRYTKYRTNLKLPLKWSNAHTSHIAMTMAKGANLDIVSAYRVGGLAGEFPVGGFYRNEFRARQVNLIDLSHQITFKSDRKLIFHGTFTGFERINLTYFEKTPASQQIASAGGTLYWGIRSLKGLPLIIRYAEGLNVHHESKESHRRELMVALIAGF